MGINLAVNLVENKHAIMGNVIGECSGFRLNLGNLE